MECSNLGYQTWGFAIYILLTSLNGVSSMKLHRDLRISQKAAWFLLHWLTPTIALGALDALRAYSDSVSWLLSLDCVFEHRVVMSSASTVTIPPWAGVW